MELWYTWIFSRNETNRENDKMRIYLKDFVITIETDEYSNFLLYKQVIFESNE